MSVRRVHRPCDACPWRKDAEPGRFDPERWEALRVTSVDEDTQASPEYGDALFACHKSPEGEERTCAGWLAMEGVNHPTIRLALVTGALPVCAVSPGEDWPALHETFAETARHDLSVPKVNP